MDYNKPGYLELFAEEDKTEIISVRGGGRLILLHDQDDFHREYQILS